jgi:hypothetical protein
MGIFLYLQVCVQLDVFRSADPGVGMQGNIDKIPHPGTFNDHMGRVLFN